MSGDYGSDFVCAKCIADKGIGKSIAGNAVGRAASGTSAPAETQSGVSTAAGHVRARRLLCVFGGMEIVHRVLGLASRPS